MGKTTVGKIINAKSTDAWLVLGQKFVAAAGTKYISKIPQLSGMMNIFGTTMKIYAAALKILGVYEKIVPIINLAVKINDIVTFNFATIAELAQDVLSMLGGLAQAFFNAGLMALKEFILNFPFYFPDVPPAKLTSVYNKVVTTKKTIKTSYKNNLKKLNPRDAVAPSVVIDGLSGVLSQGFNDLDALINAHLAALVHGSETPTQWKELILSTTLYDLTNSTLPTGIEVDDAGIYEYITLQIQNLLNKISQVQKESTGDITIDISEETAGLDSKAVSSMNTLKNIYLDSAQQSEIFYKDQVFSRTAYRENADIIILIKSFKDYMEKEILKKKKKYYKDMQKIIKNETDIETIRTYAISIVFEPIDWYDIFSFSVMLALMQTITDDNDQADLYDTSSDISHLSGSLNDDIMNVAANIFNNSVSDIASLISDRLNPLPGRGLEDGQVTIDGLDTCGSDTIDALTLYINGMGAFNLNAILLELMNIINDLYISASINETIPDIDSLCAKLDEIKNNLYNDVNTTLYDDVLKDYFKNFNVSYDTVPDEDKLLVRNYIVKSVELYVTKTLGVAHDAIHKGSVPCRNCVSCDGLKTALLSAINTIKIPNLKYSMNKALEEGISALPFTGNSTTDKALVTDYLAAPSTLTMLNSIRDSTINNNVLDAILERVFKDQQLMMIDAIKNRLGA
jgi:hypothetical protein